MLNPFKAPLVQRQTLETVGDSTFTISPNDTLNTDNINPGVNTLLPVGNVSELMQATAPGYAGQYGLGFRTIGGVQADTNDHSIRTGGALDMRTPWDIGGVPAMTTRLVVTGPVSGGDNGYTGQRDALPSFDPNRGGPVNGSGASDYSIALTQAEFATRAKQYSQLAVANALISAV